MSVFFLSIPSKKLSQSITSLSTSFKLSNIKSWKRNSLGVAINLAHSDFGTRAFGCFRNDTSTKIEIFEFDPATIASANITILKRGLDFNGDLTTETTAYKLDWSANETTVQLGTDVPQLFQYLKEYIDAAAIAGAVDATTTAKGIVEIATQAEVSAKTTTGGTGASLALRPDHLLMGLAADPAISTAATTTLSLTTIANQRVIVWAKGDVDNSFVNGDTTITLAYNGVTKDSARIHTPAANAATGTIPFTLMYTETPGAATQNITVSGGQNVVIIVLKL